MAHERCEASFEMNTTPPARQSAHTSHITSAPKNPLAQLGGSAIRCLQAPGEQEPGTEWPVGSFGVERLAKRGTILEQMVTRETVRMRRFGGGRGGEAGAGR